MSDDEPRFISKLFDFSFDYLIARGIVKGAYAMYVILVMGGIVGGMLFGIRDVIEGTKYGSPEPTDFVLIVVAPIAGLLMMIVGRLFLELTIVAFNILDELRAIRQRWGG